MKPDPVISKLTGFYLPGLILLLCIFLLPGCKKTVYPVADFSFTGDGRRAVCTIPFTNKSSDATSFYWTFGDGQVATNEENPNHTFYEPGTYLVTLTASNPEGSSTFSRTITIAKPATKARITGVTILKIPYTDKMSNPWDPSDGPDLRIYISDSSNKRFWGPSATFENLSPASFPLYIKLPVPLEVTDFNPTKYVDYYDDDGPLQEQLMGYGNFHLSYYARFHIPTIEVHQWSVKYTVHVEWE